MRVMDLPGAVHLPELGREMHAFMAEVFPYCRSITGEGLRATLRRIGEVLPLQFAEVPTGTQVFDWTVPREWNIRDAYVADGTGRRVIDFRESNLHVVNYSVPVRRRMSLDELRPHLHTLPDHPSWVPYRTSYYADDWGFCLSEEALHRLAPGEYQVVIDSSLSPGSLSFGEAVLPGAREEEILISAHACHPSLANDNLSGVAVAAFLGKLLASADRGFTYRILFAPGTIGAIAWLAQNERRLARIHSGLVLACLGDEGGVVYKRSRLGRGAVDRAARHLLSRRGAPDQVVDFSPYGNDERQFCSPGFDLPVGALTRSGHDRAARHHTSADDLASIDPAALSDSLSVCLAILGILEEDATVTSLNPKCEPQLGRRGLYRAFGGRAEQSALESALLWVMSLADGAHTLLDIADRAGLPFAAVEEAARRLEAERLLVRERRPRTAAERGGTGP